MTLRLYDSRYGRWHYGLRLTIDAYDYDSRLDGSVVLCRVLEIQFIQLIVDFAQAARLQYLLAELFK